MPRSVASAPARRRAAAALTVGSVCAAVGLTVAAAPSLASSPPPELQPEVTLASGLAASSLPIDVVSFNGAAAVVQPRGGGPVLRYGPGLSLSRALPDYDTEWHRTGITDRYVVYADPYQSEERIESFDGTSSFPLSQVDGAIFTATGWLAVQRFDDGSEKLVSTTIGDDGTLVSTPIYVVYDPSDPSTWPAGIDGQPSWRSMGYRWAESLDQDTIVLSVSFSLDATVSGQPQSMKKELVLRVTASTGAVDVLSSSSGACDVDSTCAQDGDAVAVNGAAVMTTHIADDLATTLIRYGEGDDDVTTWQLPRETYNASLVGGLPLWNMYDSDFGGYRWFVGTPEGGYQAIDDPWWAGTHLRTPDELVAVDGSDLYVSQGDRLVRAGLDGADPSLVVAEDEPGPLDVTAVSVVGSSVAWLDNSDSTDALWAAWQQDLAGSSPKQKMFGGAFGPWLTQAGGSVFGYGYDGTDQRSLVRAGGTAPGSWVGGCAIPGEAYCGRLWATSSSVVAQGGGEWNSDTGSFDDLAVDLATNASHTQPAVVALDDRWSVTQAWDSDTYGETITATGADGSRVVTQSGVYAEPSSFAFAGDTLVWVTFTGQYGDAPMLNELDLATPGAAVWSAPIPAGIIVGTNGGAVALQNTGGDVVSVYPIGSGAPSFTVSTAVTQVDADTYPYGMYLPVFAMSDDWVAWSQDGAQGDELVAASFPTGPTTPPTTPSFNDVTDTNQFAPNITWLVQQGITTGYTDGGFHPTAAVSRQAMAAFLHRYANGSGASPQGSSSAVSSFDDVTSDNQFAADIAWLASSGVTGGYDDGGFHPTAPVSRQAMAAFLYRFAGSPDFSPPATSQFGDVPADGAFYKEITWLASTEVTTGYTDGGFHPTAPVSRQAMAAFLQRFDTLPE